MSDVAPASVPAVVFSRRRRAAFVVVTFVAATLTAVGALMVIDVHLHARLQRYSVLNVWGYRGPAVGRKRPGELRVAVLGGSAAFGYGVGWDDAVPAVLQRILQAKFSETARGPVSVVNLAYNNEGAYSFRFTLRDYAYLDYDIVSLHSGYNDLMGDSHINSAVYRHESPVFRATGYMPILPVVLREKASSWLYGDIGAGYRDSGGERVTVFRPSLAKAVGARALETAVAIGASLDRQVSRLVPESMPATANRNSTTGCGSPWASYCRDLFEAVDHALSRGKRVLVVTEPYLVGAAGARHVSQQTAMTDAFRLAYGSNPRVKYVNMGALLNLADPAYGSDFMHLTVAGCAIVARRLADAVMELLGR